MQWAWDISGTENLLGSGNIFQTDPEIRADERVPSLHGVAGLNAAEHLRSLYPRCGIIWCSDLDFSLHAFRLRVEYFFREPLNEKMFEEGMDVWLERRKAFQEQGALQHRADRKTMGSNENRWSHFMKDQ